MGGWCLFQRTNRSGAMQIFVNHENIKRYRRLIAMSEADPCRNEPRHQTLLRLLAEELAKHVKPKDKRGRA